MVHTSKLVMPAILLAAAFTASPAVPATDSAAPAAQSWLRLVDKGAYGESWEAAGRYFRNVIPKEKWVELIKAARESLGELVSRELSGSTRTTELPGAPDGDYVVLQFKTQFQNKKSATETVTLALEDDGAWRVVGYFIR